MRRNSISRWIWATRGSMPMADTARVRLIEDALAAALAARGAAVDDVAGVARDVEQALARNRPLAPLDPEGDGLEPAELNAANDL